MLHAATGFVGYDAMKKKVYCNFCGGVLTTGFHEGKDRQVCGSCGEIYYENPLPAVSVIVANEEHEVLIVRRAKEPAKDMWCFPIGFAETGEGIEEAAMRELKEEAGIEGRVLQIIDAFSESNDIYGEVLVVSYEAIKTGGTEMAGDDAVDWSYAPLTALPELAFTSQKRALLKLVRQKKAAWGVAEEVYAHLEKALKEA